jgi:hypothetical protein
LIIIIYIYKILCKIVKTGKHNIKTIYTTVVYVNMLIALAIARSASHSTAGLRRVLLRIMLLMLLMLLSPAVKIGTKQQRPQNQHGTA